VRFLKGHGTGNDFVVLPDPDGQITLTPQLVRRLCDRRFGIGADGMLRVVRTACADTGLRAGEAAQTEWFMDHHNADGSTAEMCGNGIRLYASYLAEAGLIASGRHQVATRGGIRTVEVPAGGGDVTVDMGPPVVVPPAAGAGATRSAVVQGRQFIGVPVSMGNPHLVCAASDVAALDLSGPVAASELAFPDGVNVEFFEWVTHEESGAQPPVVADGPLRALPVAGRVRMRVIERGVGETLSCGTGACAVAVAALGGPGRAVEVDVPGGRLLVGWTEQTLLLSGPAVIVAEGTWRDPVAEGTWRDPAAEGTWQDPPAGLGSMRDDPDSPER
jgi:diaminopimelate epimerase